MDRSQHNLELLALAETLLGGLVAVGAGLLYWQKIQLIQGSSTALVLAIVGLASVAYYFSLHHALKKKHLALSTLILTAITAANLGLLIVQTGGADSAFYSFWLLVIVIAGIFGASYVYVAAGASLLFFITGSRGNLSGSQYFLHHTGQLTATAVAAVLAYWMHNKWSQASAATKQAASRVGEEQMRAMALMNSINEGVIVVDSQRRIQLFNPAAAQLTGWDRDNAIGLDSSLVLKLKTSDDKEIKPEADPFAESWKQAAGIIKNNLVMMTKSGRRLPLTMSVSPLFGVNHEIKGAIALFRNVASEQEIDRQRSEFISTASHEMRTPIAALEGYISLAMNPAVATIDTRARGYLEKAHTTIIHLGDLFRDLLTSAKIEEGQLKETVQPVEVGKMIQEVVDNMQFPAQKKGITLTYQASHVTHGAKGIAPLYYVRANPERLREVVTNLIDNAIKYTDAGGVTVAMSGDNDFVSVSVKDTGLGIAPEDIPHLFQKFYRVDSSATRTKGGTGLGLYLCRHIIEGYQGRIWVDSAVGKGSSFNFSLPRISTTLAEHESEAPKVAAK